MSHDAPIAPAAATPPDEGPQAAPSIVPTSAPYNAPDNAPHDAPGTRADTGPDRVADTPTQTGAPRRRRWLPTALTIGRMLAAPLIALAVIAAGPGGESAIYWSTFAFVLYVSAALTDWLDGALARAWNVTSPLGATLDLLADKILVALTLLALIYLHVTGDADPGRFASGVVSRPIEAAGLVLLLLALTGRDLAVSVLRARAAKPGADARATGGHDAGLAPASLAPSGLAKAKTALVMTGLGVLIAAIWLASLGPALMVARIGYGAGWALLAIGAALSIWTAFGYWRAAKHAAA